MQPMQQYQPVSSQPKDPNTAFLIELVGGLFGLLGLGYFYVGRTNDGVLRLIIFLFYNLIAYVILVIGGSLTFGIGCICVPIQLLIQLGVAFWSANTLKTDMINLMGIGSGQMPQPPSGSV
jgi:TM2 domain-containing membrane protein YozV